MLQSSSFTFTSPAFELKQLIPLQFLQAVLHSIPFFLQEHLADEQVPAQPHLMPFRIICGAGGKVVVTGYNFPSLKTHPHSVGSN